MKVKENLLMSSYSLERDEAKKRTLEVVDDFSALNFMNEIQLSERTAEANVGNGDVSWEGQCMKGNKDLPNYEDLGKVYLGLRDTS